jgi:hypothetical protein
MESSALRRRPADGMEAAALGDDPGRHRVGMGKKRAAPRLGKPPEPRRPPGMDGTPGKTGRRPARKE